MKNMKSFAIYVGGQFKVKYNNVRSEQQALSKFWQEVVMYNTAEYNGKRIEIKEVL